MRERPEGPDRPAIPDRETVRGLFDWLEPSYDMAVVVYSLGQDLRWKSELLRRLDPRRGESALDLASGTGLLLDRLARHLGPERVVGLDVNWAMLRASQRNDPYRRLVRSDAAVLPFRDQSFDIVTAGYLFKYASLERLAPEIRRVLRPGGRVGGYDFSAPILDSYAGLGYSFYLDHGLPALARWAHRAPNDWTHLFDFLRRTVDRSRWEDSVGARFRDAGFEEVVIRPSLGGAITWVWAC